MVLEQETVKLYW